MRALGLCLAASLVSCMLFISPDEYGSTCRFKGVDTQCGACVAAKCQLAVDECCRDATCDADMDRLESCAQFKSDACTAVRSTARPLAACMVRECDAVCERLTGSPRTNCREPRLGEGSACTCGAGGEVNDFVCNAKAFPETVCCAPKGWPAPGLACTCRPLNCNPTNEGCFCSLGDFTPKQRECSAVRCCVDKDKCTCRSGECFAFEREVESCNAGEVDCADGQDHVESCSVRTP